MTQSVFDERLDKLAALAVRVGLNLRPGQEVVMTASIDSIASMMAWARSSLSVRATSVSNWAAGRRKIAVFCEKSSFVSSRALPPRLGSLSSMSALTAK